MIDILRLTCALFAWCLSAPAQIGAANVTYSWTPPTSGQAESTDSNFTANPAVTADVLFEHWWAYRVNADTDETYLTSSNLSITASGSHADFDWSDVDSRGLFDAELDLDVASLGTRSGRLTARMTIRNISGAPLVLDLFHYVDVDLCGAIANLAAGGALVHEIRSSSCPSELVSVEAFGADRWCVTQFSFDECGITTAGPATLPNSGLPFGPGDYSGAFQWQSRLIPIGESLSVVATLQHNRPQCSARARVGTYGVASPPNPAFGSPFLQSTPPAIGGITQLTWGNAVPNATGVLLVGDAATSVPLQNLLIQVVPSLSLPITADASGAGTLALVLQDPVACDTPLFLQAMFLDTTAAPLGLRHSAGLAWAFGN